MKAEFEKQLKQLLGVKERTLLMTDERYVELVAQTKEANERRSTGLELSGLHYRRLKRFDVVTIDGREKLAQKNEKGQSSQRVVFCMASEMFDAVHSAHLDTGHKKEKGMELELKKNYCNITREVIAIYLSLCRVCALKKRFKAKGVGPELASRCQIDVIDMQSEPDGKYKFILNYQDYLTKFMILRPMITRTPSEVADILFDIFCLIGVPNVLICPSERGFCNKVLQVLSGAYNVKLLNGDPKQESIRKASEDIRKILKDKTSTRTWTHRIRMIQSSKNRSFNLAIKRTPHEALFGSPQRNGVTSSCLDGTDAAYIETEEELREHLSIIKEKLEEVKKIRKQIPKKNGALQKSQEVKEAPITCVTCKKSLNPEVTCWKCKGHLHFNCALTNDISENPFCRSCANETPVSNYWEGHQQLEDFTTDFGDHLTQHASTSFIVGDRVLVDIDEMQDIHVVEDVEMKNTILERLFSRKELTAEKTPSGKKKMANGIKGHRSKLKKHSGKAARHRHSKSTKF